jgi:TonB-dependent SusC/RagA subfamily outer membrane receptor
MIRKVLCVLLLIVVNYVGNAQTTPEKWKSIEDSIGRGRNLELMATSINEILKSETAVKNEANIARCLYDLMQIKDKRTEDTLFFKNAVFIDSVLNDRNSSALTRVIMEIMKGDRIRQFNTRLYYRHNKNLYKSYDGVNYGMMDKDALYDQATAHYNKALQIAVNAGITDAAVFDLLWLCDDPLLFLFKPVLADIIYSKRIDNGILVKDYGTGNYTNPLESPPYDFIMNLGRPFPSNDVRNVILERYDEWMKYHRQQPEAFHFIESLSKKSLYNSFRESAQTDSAYEQYLLQSTLSPFSAVKANAVYQLCLAWNKKGSKYNPGDDSYYGRNNSFDSSYRDYYSKALDLFAKNEKVLDSFLYVKDILTGMQKSILSKRLKISFDDTQSPGKPTLAFLQYKNVSRLLVRIVKVNIEQQRIIQQAVAANVKSNLYNNDKGQRVVCPPVLLALQAVKEFSVAVPSDNDHQLHNTYFKIDGLNEGNYYVLYSDSIISSQSENVGFLPLQVNNVVVMNNDERIFVLNRQTGFPLKNAVVDVIYEDSKVNHKLLKVNEDGYVTVQTKVDYVKVYAGRDTVLTHINDPQEEKKDEYVYDKKEDDDLMSYYEDNTKLNLFTDRAIYRPGQTVHFKGIFITRNPKTGEAVILNWKNLKFPFFKKLLYKLQVKTGKARMEFDLEDPFLKVMDSLFLVPDQFGAVAGSFVIPANAATGEWSITNLDSYDTDHRNDGTFKVEEYKRPSFEMKLFKPEKDLYLKDSFSVKVKVRTFAGASLDKVVVKYTVRRTASIPFNGANNDWHTSWAEADFAGEGYTNDQGEFFISVADTALLKFHFDDTRSWNADYNFEVSAVDATGESHEENVRFSISSKPISIKIPLGDKIDKSALAPFAVVTRSPFAGDVKKQVSFSLYKLSNYHPTADYEKQLEKADVWLSSKEILENDFPELKYANKPSVVDSLIYQTSIKSGGDEKISLPKDKLQPGYYRMKTLVMENGSVIGEATSILTLYDKQSRTLPVGDASFDYMPFNGGSRGQSIQWLSGNNQQDIFSIYHASYYAKTKNGVRAKNVYDLKIEKKGLNEWSYTIPEDYEDELTLTHLYIVNGKLHRQQKTITVSDKIIAPEIGVTRYRKILTPGEQQTFEVTIKTKNEKALAQLMTAMYDASLDKLEKHPWEIPGELYERRYLRTNWDREITSSESSTLYFREMYKPKGEYTLPLWWMKDNSMNPIYSDNIEEQMLAGRVAGVSITSTNGLNDVVVIGYGTTKKMNITGASVTIRGFNSISRLNIPLVILDGVEYHGDFSKIEMSTIVDAIVLKDADATAIYGAKAANGVILLSTKGSINLSQLQKNIAPPPVVVMRKNFNETAFFYPKIYADKNGSYKINFTLPESVTEWKWTMFAHTKNALFAYAERTINSQLPLMVQPSVPRLLYQGDTIVLKSRITNLDTADQHGKTQCFVEDIETGEDVSDKFIIKKQTDFFAKQNGNTTVSYSIAVPENYLHPLRIKISATTNNYGDGEEHIIPVLSRKILVAKPVNFSTQSQPLKVVTPTLPPDAQPYGISLFIAPKPQSAMINALPYLANYVYGCAEQTFNKLFANAIALHTVRTDTSLQRELKTLNKNIGPKKNSDSLVATINENAMPWLTISHKGDLQHANLSALLDTVKAIQNIEKHFATLKAMQLKDGGMTWFSGGKSDYYISLYILGRFGKMHKDDLIPFKTIHKNDLDALISSLIVYCDSMFSAEKKQSYFSNNSYYLYARSFWLNDYPLIENIKRSADSVLQLAWKNIDRYSLSQQASMITTTLQCNDSSLKANAMRQLESIRQIAINDDRGIRWKQFSNYDDFSSTGEEAIVRIAEAFETANYSPQTITGIINWLLNTKQDHQWSTTKATSDVVSLLNGQKFSMAGETKTLSTSIGPNKMDVSDNLISGRLFDFVPTQTGFPTGFSVIGTPATSGSANYYYFTENPADSLADGIMINKKMYRYNQVTQAFDIPITPGDTLKVGEKIRTTLTITATKQLSYVFIEDKRAACFEPADAGSGYEYGNGFSYYKSVRDEGFQFFANSIPSGISTIVYETTVNQEGFFHNGPASLQCMYQPGIKAYGAGGNVRVGL